MSLQNRREFLKSSLAGGVGMGTLSSLMAAGGGVKQPLFGKTRPNIVFIMCDQLNALALSCYGGQFATPNIDRIANEGVRFDQATCTTPFCSPSRASMVTGMYPHAHGIIFNCSNTGKKKDLANYSHPSHLMDGLTPDDITTERILYEAGYATHHYGKWHLDGDDLPYYRDMYRTNLEYAMEMADVFWKVRKNDKNTWMNWYNWSLPVEIAPPLQKAVKSLGNRWDGMVYSDFITKMGKLKFSHEQNYEVHITDKTVGRIKNLGDKPFMITCSFNGPHDPNVVHSPYYDMFDPKKIKLLPNGDFREKRFEKDISRRIVADLDEDSLREFMRIYYGMVKLIDEQVGRILDALQTAGKIDDTIILFTADHSDMMSGHGMVWKSTSAFYDEVARIPLLIRYPKRFKPQVSELAVDGTDFMPTLLNLTSMPIPKQAQGQNLVPFLTGQKEPSKARSYTFSERVSSKHRQRSKVSLDADIKGSFMVRGKGYKYIQYGKDEYLYNLTEDPGETKNLVKDSKYRSVHQEMVQELNNWLKRTNWPG
ncbi:MAG: sulfatase family protein [Planctomycetota bacterium]|jgi:arylsulfatase A-like enzyme